jgi:hypothetical protein
MNFFVQRSELCDLYDKVAAGERISEADALRVAAHRLRKRYRQLLRDEIANTLSNPAMVDEEMRALFGAFAA